MNKKGFDYPIITFFIIIFGLILLAPIMLKLFISIKTPISAQLGNMTGGTVAQTNFNKVIDTTITFWDKIIIAAFFLSCILLVISSIFIDSSPFFVILYIFISFMLVLFAPNIIDSLSSIYDSSNFSTEVSYLTFIDGLRTHFGEFLVGIIILTGIIIYGKLALFNRQGNRQ